MRATHNPHRAGRVGFFSLLLSLILLGVPAVAYAVYTDNIMPNANFNGFCNSGNGIEGSGEVCLTDNNAVSFWIERPIDTTTSRSDTPAELQINTSLERDFNITDLNTAYDTTPVWSGPGETDIVYRSRPQDFRDSGTVGYYWCDDPAGTGIQNKCDQGYVNLRRTDYSPAAYMRAIVCHESGHAVGLLHPTDAAPRKDAKDTRFECMMNAPVAAHYGLGADPNRANINSVY